MESGLQPVDFKPMGRSGKDEAEQGRRCALHGAGSLGRHSVGLFLTPISNLRHMKLGNLRLVVAPWRSPGSLGAVMLAADQANRSLRKVLVRAQASDPS